MGDLFEEFFQLVNDIPVEDLDPNLSIKNICLKIM